ncbi:Imm1 family immunity protein [Virgisporangium aurantiacum]|uniref:Uncharacterized protein n=1 Tax=Virgisporangium aurantiacum TaxID=175570 RepID=A0A8J3Z2I2_9ACTN|nr:Imm1 family immunity protein [Virgisporangium aurantiacum]GIJ56069.1 hypothetical protein Vau01_035850 [Virgisporangium aurantiacum]
MTFRVHFDMCKGELPDGDAVREFFDQRREAFAPHGGRANAYWFAPVGADDVLRLDIDYDNGRAALRWLPDGTHAEEFDQVGPIVVMESSDYDVVTIPAELARVSADTAHGAVTEYITTGAKPASVEWAPDNA